MLHLCVWHIANAAAYFVSLHNERMCTRNDNDMSPCRLDGVFGIRLNTFHSLNNIWHRKTKSFFFLFLFFFEVKFLFAFVRVEHCTRCTPYYMQVRRTTKFDRRI
ncbi:hypothetical protein AMTRI_Chr07g76010 [Amborella trichopoda]